jgi:hypothetical protein
LDAPQDREVTDLGRSANGSKSFEVLSSGNAPGGTGGRLLLHAVDGYGSVAGLTEITSKAA